jgi:hypothetical protein
MPSGPPPPPNDPVPQEPPPAAPAVKVAQQVPDWRSKSFDFAADATKQLITVATGVVTAAVIFSKDFSPTGRGYAVAAWIFLILSVICGIVSLLGLVGQLTNSQDGPNLPTLSGEKSIIRPAAGAQVGLFLVGMVFLIIFGFKATPASSSDSKTPINCIVQPAPPQVIKVEIKNPEPPTVKPHGRRVVRRCCCCPAKH